LNFFFCLLRLRRYKAKCVKTRCLQEGVGHLQPRFQGERVISGEYFFGFYKTRHILLSDSVNCTVLRAVVLTQYRQTDGIAVASTALAMRALRRAVKILASVRFPINCLANSSEYNCFARNEPKKVIRSWSDPHGHSKSPGIVHFDRSRM